MDHPEPRPAETSDVDRLARDLERVADRLRSASDVRLAQPLGPAGSRAAQALDLAQTLADAAQGIEERATGRPPTGRVVPDLGVFALGDQVAVTGHDLLAALEGLPSGTAVWSGSRREPWEQVLAEVTEAVVALRRVL